jgi:hypothetical protein
MTAFESYKEVLACYKALENKERGCIKRAQTLVDYLKTQEKGANDASIKRLKREINANKKLMPKKDW